MSVIDEAGVLAKAQDADVREDSDRDQSDRSECKSETHFALERKQIGSVSGWRRQSR